MRKRLYVSGPMSGYVNNNFEAFEEATTRLRAAGYNVLSPAEMNSNKELTWEEYLIADLALMFHCDYIAMLPGWESSRGATLELANAVKLGLTVIDAVTLNVLDVKCTIQFQVTPCQDFQLMPM